MTVATMMPRRLNDICRRRSQRLSAATGFTTGSSVGELDHASERWHYGQHEGAENHRDKSVEADGSIIQSVVWKVPTPVPPTDHEFKYSMVYIQDDVRVVGFDNERGKGDHMHLDGKEFPYRFTTIDQLIEDFVSEVEKRRQS
ncbi:DUF6516 family protein [Agrobacterium sp. CR_3]|uniref:toxin-antitoxin system TumE family protein n=1 Tax=unclassified Agrobacterium TaxID=2632611 RepID=UPI0035C1AA9A